MLTRTRRSADVTSPAPRAIWREIVASDPSAMVTQTPEWQDGVCRTGGYLDASRLYQLPSCRRMILPLVATTVAGVRIAEESLPYGWGYGGAVVEGGELSPEDARVVVEDLAHRPVIRSGLTPTPLTDPVWSSVMPQRTLRVPFRAQILDLDGGFERVWSTRFKTQARNRIRKSERAGLEVYKDENGRHLAAFAEVYAKSVDWWARQRHQPRALARILARRRDRVGQLSAAFEAVGAACTLWVATLADEPVAVNVVLKQGQHALGWLSASDQQVSRQTQASYLLVSRAIEDACGDGVRYFNMGESDPGSQVEHWKAQFGPRSYDYDMYRFERVPATRALTAARSATQRVLDRAGTLRVSRP